VRFPCVHAVATTPAQRLGVLLRSLHPAVYQPSPIWRSGRPAHRPFRGLLGVHSRYGLHTRAVTVYRDPLIRRLQPLRYLHSCSGCFRLERLPGGTCTHWKAPPFHGARHYRTHAPQQKMGIVYSITSSARNSKDSEIVKPNALEVLRLMTSSNLVGRWIGKSAGPVPLIIWSAKPAKRR